MAVTGKLLLTYYLQGKQAVVWSLLFTDGLPQMYGEIVKSLRRTVHLS